MMIYKFICPFNRSTACFSEGDMVVRLKRRVEVNDPTVCYMLGTEYGFLEGSDCIDKHINKDIFPQARCIHH